MTFIKITGKLMEIQYYNRKKGIVEVEKVYGESGIKWLYESSLGLNSLTSWPGN